jgi:dipeptidyl aminopeptidase/acylaminoacyl peptidase
VPSRFLYFPDEGHWVLKPQNQVVWWTTVHEWLARYLKPGAPAGE